MGDNWFIEIIGWIVVGIGFVCLIALLFAIPTWLLWNWLMPNIFGLPEISLVQGLGIASFSSLLFGGVSRKCKCKGG